MNRRRSNKAIATVPKTPLPSPFPPQQPSLASIAKQGFSWGIGNALAHRMIGPAEPLSTNPTTTSNPSPKQVAYTQCMKDFADVEGCKHLLD